MSFDAGRRVGFGAFHAGCLLALKGGERHLRQKELRSIFYTRPCGKGMARAAAAVTTAEAFRYASNLKHSEETPERM